MEANIVRGGKGQVRFRKLKPGAVFIIHGGVYVLAEDGVSHLIHGGEGYFKTMKFAPHAPVSVVVSAVFKTGMPEEYARKTNVEPASVAEDAPHPLPDGDA